MTEPLPTTLHGAIEIVVASLTEKDRARLAKHGEAWLEMLDLFYGAWVRNEFGLSQGNGELLDACGSRNPDIASGRILQGVRRRLEGKSIEHELVPSMWGEPLRNVEWRG